MLRKRNPGPKCGHESYTVEEKLAENISEREILQLYRLVLKIRPLYIAAGEKWSKKDKLIEMKNTTGLIYQIVYSGNDIRGFISYVLESESEWEIECGKVAFIWELHVASTAQREGLGKMLLKLVKAKARYPLMLRTFEYNRRAVKFYEAMSFKKVDALSDHVSVIMVDSS